MTYRDQIRLATVIVAPLVSLTAWGVTQLVGIDLVLKTGNTIGAVEVLLASVAAGMTAWFVARQLERRSGHPRSTWSFIGSTALAVSVIAPSWLADGSIAVSLISMLAVLAVVVTAGFAATLPVHRGDRGLSK